MTLPHVGHFCHGVCKHMYLHMQTPSWSAWWCKKVRTNRKLLLLQMKPNHDVIHSVFKSHTYITIIFSEKKKEMWLFSYCCINRLVLNIFYTDWLNISWQTWENATFRPSWISDAALHEHLSSGCEFHHHFLQREQENTSRRRKSRKRSGRRIFKIWNKFSENNFCHCYNNQSEVVDLFYFILFFYTY